MVVAGPGISTKDLTLLRETASKTKEMDEVLNKLLRYILGF